MTKFKKSTWVTGFTKKNKQIKYDFTEMDNVLRTFCYFITIILVYCLLYFNYV